MSTRNRTKPAESVWKQASYSLQTRWTDRLTGITGDWMNSTSQVISYYDAGLVSESMSDVIGCKGQENPCTHSCVRVLNGPVTSLMYDIKVTARFIIEYRAVIPLTPSASLVSDSGHMPHSAGLATLARARIPALCRSDMTGLISLAEAREMSNSGALKLLSALARLAAAAYRGRPTPSLRREFRLAVMGEGTIQGFVSHLLGANLEWKFGWAPFVKDVQAATRLFHRVSEIQAKLASGYRVYGRAVEDQNVSIDLPLSEPYQNVNTVRLSYDKKTRIVATASVKRRIKKDHTGPEWQLALALYTEVMGLKPSLATAWQLIPLSFVIDWVLPVGAAIEAMEGMTTPQSNWIESYGGLESLSRITTVTGQYRTAFNSSFGLTQGSRSATSTVIRNDYSRSNSALTGTSPIYVPSLNWQNISPGKWFTGMELLLQRMLR